MKGTKVVVALFALLLFASALHGCGGDSKRESDLKASEKDSQDRNDSDRIQKIVAQFYEGAYEYKKTDAYYDGEKESSVIVKEGKVIHSPSYKEYTKIAKSTDGSLWNEAYFYGDGEAVNAVLITNEGQQRLKLQAEQPYGYGEDLDFTLDESGNDTDNKVYKTQYSINIGRNYGLEDSLTATVGQTYYINKKSNTLTKIVTDLTDSNEKTYMANDISANGTSMEEAKKNAESQTNLKEIQTLEISNYNGDISIEIPGEA